MILVNEYRAQLGKPVIGFANPSLYTLARNNEAYSDFFHDIQQGNNGYFNAVPGYDLVTGIGTINGLNLMNGLTCDALICSAGTTLAPSSATTPAPISITGSPSSNLPELSFQHQIFYGR